MQIARVVDAYRFWMCRFVPALPTLAEYLSELSGVVALTTAKLKTTEVSVDCDTTRHSSGGHHEPRPQRSARLPLVRNPHGQPCADPGTQKGRQDLARVP